MFSGACVHITVKNPRRVACGVRSITVDGKPAQMPLTFAPGTTPHVVVTM